MQQHTSRYKPTIAAQFCTLANMITHGYELCPSCMFFFRDGYWWFDPIMNDRARYYDLCHELVHQLKPEAYAIISGSEPIDAVTEQGAAGKLIAAVSHANGATMTFVRSYTKSSKGVVQLTGKMQEFPAIFRSSPTSRMFSDPPPALVPDDRRESFFDAVRGERDRDLRRYTSLLA
ncbi:hypothetical protein [Pseudomonas schmalbachii]|uniref:Uncharacterized protein n=1 Tax=Pseudomonas schmalbachii TaxID=2816993 RepID=A0ABS3TJ91_9PSED|nr:hypothetical protein [Pseudomonas schmalbachii]MBO3273716.1 hypothetical protein [Pseudomonas schmalbachii]